MYDVMAKRIGDRIKVVFPEEIFNEGGGTRVVITFLNLIQQRFTGHNSFNVVDSDRVVVNGIEYRIYWLEG